MEEKPVEHVEEVQEENPWEEDIYHEDSMFNAFSEEDTSVDIPLHSEIPQVKLEKVSSNIPLHVDQKPIEAENPVID